jgi:hypothetical protein
MSSTVRACTFASVALLLSSVVGCTADAGSSGEDGASEEALTEVSTGTYVVDDAPYRTYYLERLTLSAGKKFEADYVSERGARTTIAGTYRLYPARANNPNSPVASDKPSIMLASDTGPAPVFEIDQLPGGGLRLYHSARQETFTMKKDPSFQPAPTVTKTLVCTSSTVDARVILDKAQNRRGTLEVTRKSGATYADPRSGKMGISIILDEWTQDWIHFEGSHDSQDFYFGIKKDDFERGTGDAYVNLSWAESGQQFRLYVDCSFAP